MNKQEKIGIPVLKIEQPIGEFFVGSISASDLVRISYADVRRLEDRDVEKYLGIQRPLSKKRKAELKEYVRTVDACFPTSVILAIEEENVFYDTEQKKLVLSPTEDVPLAKIAKILDGQHRVAGLEDIANGSLIDGEISFDVNVSIFIGADIPTQAQIFSKVNLAQNKVNKSLAYDLAGLADSRTPERTGHEIAVALDNNQNSPFYKKIKRLGVNTPGRKDEVITQATFINALLPLYTENKIVDRDILMRGKKLEHPSQEQLKKMPMRSLFVEEKDLEMAKLVWSFFSAISERWSEAWNTRQKGTMLYRTNGFKAFMRFFKDVYLLICEKNKREIGSPVTKSEFLGVLEKVNIPNSEFTTESFQPGGAGENALYNRLRESLEELEMGQ